jgi:hypothetical protein
MSSSANVSGTGPNGAISVAPIARVAPIAKVDQYRELLGRIAEKAVWRALYDKPVQGARKLTGDAFTLLQHIYVAAASAATESSGAVIVAGTKQLKAALRRLPGDRGEISDGTVRPFVSYWKHCFRRHGTTRPDRTPSGEIVVRGVRVGRRSYVVRLYMRYADRGTCYYWLDIEDARGQEILVTPQGKLEETAIELGAVLDDELYKRAIRNTRVLRNLRKFFDDNPKAGRALVLVGLLAAMSLHPTFRAEARELVLRAVRWVTELIAQPAPAAAPRVQPRPPAPSTPAPTLPGEPPPLASTSSPVSPSSPIFTQSNLAAVARSLIPAPEPGQEPILNEEQLRAATYRLLAYDPRRGEYRAPHTRGGGLDPHAWNMRANVVSRSDSSVQVSLRPVLRSLGWAMKTPAVVKWTVLAVDPTGNLTPIAQPIGKQVFVSLNPMVTHAILMVAESDYFNGPPPPGQSCATERQEYELGLGILPPLEGTLTGADDILLFRQQDMSWEPGIHPTWDETNSRLAQFLIMLPKIDPETEELVIHYGDGSSDDRDFINMVTSRYSGAWYASHEYKEAGPKTVRVEVLNKKLGTHPNHPVKLTLKKEVVVPDLRDDGRERVGG